MIHAVIYGFTLLPNLEQTVFTYEITGKQAAESEKKKSKITKSHLEHATTSSRGMKVHLSSSAAKACFLFIVLPLVCVPPRVCVRVSQRSASSHLEGGVEIRMWSLC